MTKPEGPAQEPQACPSQHLPCGCEWEPCEEDPRGPIFWNRFNGVAQCHMCGQVYSVPATPAPSQPAGAREWLKANHRDLLMRLMNGHAMTGAELAELLDAFLAQQTAAKDAELENYHDVTEANRLQSLRANFCDKHREMCECSTGPCGLCRAEAAERERDSLREELERTRVDLRAQFDELAALKAGKDGQK